MTSHRFAVFSPTVPPTQKAHAILLARILQLVPSERYILISNKPVDSGLAQEERYFYLPTAQTATREAEIAAANKLEGVLGAVENPALLKSMRVLLRFYRKVKTFTGRLRAHLQNHNATITAHAARLENILQHEQINLLVVCSGGNVHNLPAAYLAAQRLSIPLIVYMFDYYSREMFAEQFVARQWEERILRSAAAIIVNNEGQRDIYRQLYGLESTVLYNPCELNFSPGGSKPYLRQDVFNIVYTGSVWGIHHDGFRRLAQAVNRLGDTVCLHIFSGNPSFIFRLQGIEGPQIAVHSPLPQDEVYQVQHEADLLVLAFSFDGTFEEILSATLTTKLGEYLAAGRPILVHAPPDTFVNKYLRQHNSGIVVDQPDVAALVTALQTLMNDDSLRTTLGQRARACAEADFDSQKMSERFAQIVSQVSGTQFYL